MKNTVVIKQGIWDKTKKVLPNGTAKALEYTKSINIKCIL